ncbi:tryptophan-rich sensory protein [Chloroflexi bacterium CFX2]|nr:tryptophan-rich sensory protein [Chloroflexi bacterium CFX2]
MEIEIPQIKRNIHVERFVTSVRQPAGAALALAVNILASTLPLNGQNTGEISDRFQVYFVPAGYVFAIWGVIYIGWIAFTIYQFLPSQKESPRMQRLGYLFALSSIANAAWLFCWHYNQFGLSVLVMLSLLGLLIASYLRLDVNRRPVSAAERWSVDIPFSVYLGWITVATVANITDWLYLIEWNGFGIAPQTWAVIMLAAASLLGAGMAITRRDAAYLSVLVWAFIGIAAKQTPAPMVVTAAWIAAALMAGLIVYSLSHRARLG